MRIFWMLLVGLSFVFNGEAIAQTACKNFVGGVCLDKKKAPAKKPIKKSKPKKVIKKKKAAPKKVVAPEPQPVQPAQPVKVSANTCVKMSAGKASSMDFYKNVVYTNVVVRNTCSETITVYMKLNGCKSPKAYFNQMVGNSSKKFKLRKGGAVSHRIAHQEGLQGASTLARTNAAYGGAKASFPKFGC
jgi:hypothetical protein